MKSSPSIWHYVVSVKSTVKISSIFVAFLENMNFTETLKTYHEPSELIETFLGKCRSRGLIEQDTFKIKIETL